MEVKLLSKKETVEYQNEIEEIFWLTSSKTEFKSSIEKKNFQEKYLGSYLNNDLVLVVVEKQVLAYLLCRIESSDETFLENYSSHLHINCHPSSQGKGLGTKLINKLKQELEKRRVNGVHLVTLSGHPNVQFYLKNDFEIIDPSSVEENKPIYLGYSLNKKG